MTFALLCIVVGMTAIVLGLAGTGADSFAACGTGGFIVGLGLHNLERNSARG